jgi:hypothetical protein
MLAVRACSCLSEALKGWALLSSASMREKGYLGRPLLIFLVKEQNGLEATRSHRRRQLMMCKISTVVRRMFSLMEDLKQGTTITTVGKHR